MPVKLIQLPHLHLPNSSSLPVTLTTMKTNTSLSRVGPVFTRVFPHRLNYQFLSSSNNLGFPNLITTTLPELSFSTEHGFEIKAAKSLIEDESELGDWFSEVNSGSLKKRQMHRKRDDGGNDSSGGGRGGSSVRRTDAYNRGIRERGGGNRGYFGRSSSGKGRFGGEFGSRDEGYVSRRENRFENGRGGRGNSRGRGRGRFEGEVNRRNDDFSRDSSKGKGNWGSFYSFPRGKEPYVRDTEREDDPFVSKRRDDRFNGSGRGRGGGRGGGGGGVRTGVKERGNLMILDEENVDDEEGETKLIDSLSELISDEEESDDYKEDVEDNGVLRKGRSMSGLDSEDSPMSLPRVSTDGSESYLSETRCVK